jgi:hypothetical protein
VLGPLDLWEDVEEDVTLDWRTAGDVIWERTTTITTISYDITCTCNLAMLMFQDSERSFGTESLGTAYISGHTYIRRTATGS